VIVIVVVIVVGFCSLRPTDHDHDQLAEIAALKIASSKYKLHHSFTIAASAKPIFMRGAAP